MKLSIWRQFSSNHSSSFTVVGEFPTRSDAERASQRIREILNMLTEWHAAHEEEMHDWWSSGEWGQEASPPEKELAAQYNIDWIGAIDWFHSARIEIVLDRLVFITPIQRPEADGRPFDQIMNKLGGKGYHEGDVYGSATAWIVFDLTCIAPDERTAITLYNQHLGFNRRIYREGSRLHFDRWRFDQEPSLPDLIEELDNLGCSEVEYSFTQLDLDGKYKIELHGANDVEVLLEVMHKAEDSEDQREAANILGEIADSRAVDVLVEALESPADVWLRIAIASALAKIADLRAVEPLIRLLNDPDYLVRRVAVAALGKIADPEAVEPLIRSLQDDRIWDQAVNALGSMGTLAWQPLQTTLEVSVEPLKSRIEIALQRIEETLSGGKLLADLRSADENVRRAAFEQIEQENDLETMLAFLQNPNIPVDSQLQDQIINRLIESGDARIVSVLAERINVLGQTAILALTKIGVPAVEALTEIANHSELWIKQSAMNALAQIGNPRSFDLLLKALITPDPIQRRIAALGLGKIGDVRAVRPLVETLLAGGDMDGVIFQSIQQLHGESELV
ncbi:MAG: HEAT repeat domain-containing protein, partial [Chloroflexota bacterium]